MAAALTAMRSHQRSVRSLLAFMQSTLAMEWFAIQHYHSAVAILAMPFMMSTVCLSFIVEVSTSQNREDNGNL